MADYNAFKGQSSDKQSSDGCNTGIGVAFTGSKVNDPKAPKLGGSANSDKRGPQGEK